MANSLAQILEIKDLIDSKQFLSAKMKLKNLKSNLELKKLFEFQIIVQNKKTKLKKFKIIYYDNLKYFEGLGKKKFLILFHNLAGDYYFEQNKFGHAINDYIFCLRMDKENTHATLGLAKSYRLLGLYEISETYYLKITHSYDWNLDNLQDNSESNTPQNYSKLSEIIKNENFEFLSKNILVDIGILYTSNNDNIGGKSVFKEILANMSDQNIIDPSYLCISIGHSNIYYNSVDERKTQFEKPLPPKIKFVTKIKNIFPDFSNKYESEINKGNFHIDNHRKILTISLDTLESKIFFIIERKLPSKYGKNVYVYAIIPKQQKFEEITSALFLYLSKEKEIKELINTINLESMKISESSNLNFSLEELLEFYFYSLNDNLALFLLKKKQHNEDSRNTKYPFYYLYKCNQIIKEINDDKNFKDKLDGLSSEKLEKFKEKFEESLEDYSKLPEYERIENPHMYRYDEIKDHLKHMIKIKKNRKKSVKS